jgi:hypothetical protein
MLYIILIARNGAVYAGISYRNFFLFLNVIPTLINIYYVYPFMFIFYFLTVCICFAFKKYTGTSNSPFRTLIILHNKQVLVGW